MNFDNFVKIPNTSRYASIGNDDSYIVYLTIDNTKNAITGDAYVDILSFVRNLYPKEIHIPKYNIKNIELTEETTFIALDIILYSGEKDNVEIKIDNQTGKIIE